MKALRALLPVLALAALVSVSSVAEGAISTYVLAVGYNGAPPAEPGHDEAPLQYADDDAVAFYAFAREFSREGALLTVMDADTQARFPREVTEARPPSVGELRAEVQRFKERLEDDRKRGDESILLLFYSGHGSRPQNSAPALTLLDGALTRERLYDDVLASIPARYVHVFIDACYAEAIVRPRDAEAASVELSQLDLAQYASRSTLARFPHVGAIVASSGSSQSHEWDGYRHGVFTQELLSGLRGAADVNLDAKIEYSELYAFLSAANRNVGDPRARLAVVARPPGSNARAPIVDLRDLKARASVTDITAHAGHVHFEDQRGNRLADLRAENGARLAIALPSSMPMYVRNAQGEAELTLKPGETIAFDRIVFGPPAARVRGALDLAMRRGLFAAGFGPNYYRGFIDQSTEFVPVPLPEADTVPAIAVPDEGKGWRQRAVYLGGGVTESIGRGLGAMGAVRLGWRPQDASGFTVSLDGAWGKGVFSEWRAVVSAGYRVGLRVQRVNLFGGIEVGGGVVSQTATADASGLSGTLLAAPMVGATYQLADRFALGFEGALNAVACRSETGSTIAVFLPSALLGVAMDL